MRSAYLSERRWQYDAPPAAVWAALGDTDRYQSWWPWLRAFDPDGGLATGARWTCAVRSPLAYEVAFDVELVDVVERRSIDAVVAGDIHGTARLEVLADGGGTAVELRSRLEARRPLLRVLSAAARPVARWGHDRVLDRAGAEFRVAIPSRPS